MLVCPVDAKTLSAQEASALARVVSLLQRVAPDTQLPNSKWTAHDTAAHLVSMIGRYVKADAQLAESPRDVEALNEQTMKEFDTATMGELVGRLRSRHAKYAAFWADLPLEMVLPIRSGQLPLDVAGLRTNWMTELLVHGRDIALAAGEEWPLDDSSAFLSLRLLAQALPGYLRPAGHGDGTLVVAADGGAPFSIVVWDKAAEVQPAAVTNADQLAGPPAPLVLLFYGRIGLAEAQASGVRIVGDADHVQRVLERFEKP